MFVIIASWATNFFLINILELTKTVKKSYRPRSEHNIPQIDQISRQNAREDIFEKVM